jgi:hypothetical protein
VSELELSESADELSPESLDELELLPESPEESESPDELELPESLDVPESAESPDDELSPVVLEAKAAASVASTVPGDALASMRPWTGFHWCSGSPACQA